jgi:mannose-6-phosphate isomerase-like protein (cupin superfamily)
MSQTEAVVRYLDETPATDCPYGNVRRVVTGGLGGVANVHVVTVTAGSPHVHTGYDETYYVLAGTGTISLAGRDYALRPGAVVVIPRGTEHALQADRGQSLEFVIFGTPAMVADDERFIPRKP